MPVQLRHRWSIDASGRAAGHLARPCCYLQIVHANRLILQGAVTGHNSALLAAGAAEQRATLTHLVQAWPGYGPQVDRSLWLTTKSHLVIVLFSSPRRTVLSDGLWNLELVDGFPKHVIA